MGGGEESEDLGCVAIKFNWSPVWVATKNVVLCKEKNSMKGEFKWDFERLRSDFWSIAKHWFQDKGKIVLQNNIFLKIFWD